MRSWRHRSEALRRRRGEIHARPLQRGRDAEASAKANHRSRLVSHTAPPQKRGASTHQGRGAMPQSDQPQHRERQADHRVVRARQGRGEPTPWHQRTRRCAGELRPPAVPRGSVRSTAATAAATRGGAGRCSRNLNPLTRVRLRESGSDFSRRCYRAWAAGTSADSPESGGGGQVARSRSGPGLSTRAPEMPVGSCNRAPSDHFKAGGRGWHTRIDAALREWIDHDRSARRESAPIATAHVTLQSPPRGCSRETGQAQRRGVHQPRGCTSPMQPGLLRPAGAPRPATPARSG